MCEVEQGITTDATGESGNVWMVRLLENSYSGFKNTSQANTRHLLADTAHEPSDGDRGAEA